MSKEIINTIHAPKAIGAYSQAVKVSDTVYLSGQIGLNPETMVLADGVVNQAHQVFKNLRAVINQAGGDFKDVVKLNVYLTTMNDFIAVNQVMMEYFSEPYPARAAVAVKELPKGALVEIDGIVVL